MIDLNELLEAEAQRIEVPADVFEKVVVRARRRRRRRRACGVAIMVVVSAVALVAGNRMWPSSRKTDVVTVSPSSTASRSDTNPPHVVSAKELPVGGATDVAVDESGDVWVPGADVVRRLDGRTGEVVATIPVAGSSDYRYAAAGLGAVWVVDSGTASLTRIDPSSNTVTASVPLAAPPVGVVTGFGKVWVLASLARGGITTTNDATLSAVNPTTMQIVDHVDTRGARLSASDTEVIVSGDSDGFVHAVDPESNYVRNARPFGGAVATVWGAGDDMWIVTENSVQRFDPASLTPTGNAVHTLAGPIAVSPNAVWLLQQPSSTEPSQLQELDPAGPTTVGGPSPVGLTAVDVVASGDRVWVANFNAGTVTMLTLA